MNYSIDGLNKPNNRDKTTYGSAAELKPRGEHTQEVARGERFTFGDNWNRFLRLLNDDRLSAAQESLKQSLGVERLNGKRFLDAGSGSGLFSMAARQLGAEVYSFDYDPQSVACTAELRERYFSHDPQWTVAEGSVLDTAYLSSLGHFDIVYSWGVLHHTGAMWEALANVAPLVAPGGKMFIAIYNNQGGPSYRWTQIKRLYNRSPRYLGTALVLAIGAYQEIRAALGRVVRLQTPLPFKAWAEAKKTRGMSVWHDLVDWVGGYPFEVAKPEEIFDFYRAKGFNLIKLKTNAGGLGCNEFVFEKVDPLER